MSNMPVIDFLIASFYFAFGALIRIFKLVCFYADATKCPVFVACWEFIKFFFRMFLTRRQYKKEEYGEEAITRGNIYIDELIKEITVDGVAEYDPYLIGDSVVGFNKKMVFVNVSGEAKFHDGYIKGLSTLHRVDDCSLQDEVDRLRVKADLGAGELHFHYSGSVKFMNLGPTISVVGTLSYVEVHLEFTVDSKTGRNGKLDKFIIDDMRGMKIWVTGLGPMNWAVSPIVNGVMKIFKGFVRNFLESKVKKHVSERIPNFQFPVEGKTTQDPVTKVSETTGTETNKEPEETDPTEPETSTIKEPEETVPTDSETSAIKPVPTEPETSTIKETVPTEPETGTNKEPEETVTTGQEISTTKEPEELNPTDPETQEPEEIVPAPEESQDLHSPKPDVKSEEIAYLKQDRGDDSEYSSDEYSIEERSIMFESE